jgi:hypothetical protein
MPIAVVEQIARTLLTRLETLKASGYDNRVLEVIRPVRLNEWTPRHLQIVLTQGSAEEVPELSYPGNPPAIAIRQTFNIRGFLMPSERSNVPIETQINSFASDVRKAITTPANWYQFGSNAIDATFETKEDVSADGGLEGFNLPLSILYRTDENDPYQVRA